ncbi:hypothetical protein [Microbispora sp. GKU 823]|uniref:hypothetical protein n=1 Tax=Microbispora sp. GKU 823 TaxID=1652100 RepID=UPI002117BEB4|nr:hypothetical protein [Microbispora sp. GKU 823]
MGVRSGPARPAERGGGHRRTFVEGGLDPMAELVRVQRLAVARAHARGLDPDTPAHLTRSVILPESP